MPAIEQVRPRSRHSLTIEINPPEPWLVFLANVQNAVESIPIPSLLRPS